MGSRFSLSPNARAWAPVLSVVTLAGLSVTAAAATRPASAPGKPAKAAILTYEKDVFPLLQGRCFGCHGAGAPHAGLDLHTVQDLLEGGHSGTSVVPGAPEKSLLYQMLADGRMPKGGGRFSPAELKVVAAWIRTGAKGKPGGGHWAFRPPSRPTPPTVRAVARVRNSIDRFLLADLERQKLSYSPEADRRTLIRRVTYDLIGLPPTPADVEAYLNDRSPDAYEKVVDRLLADPRYGERWARHWLDTAGYADSEGVLQEDRIRPNAWRYRDYVIRAFNSDKPYNQFLREQLAGDEISDYRNAKEFTPELIDTLSATGFLRTAVDATRDDFNPHQFGEYQYRMLHDVETIVATTTLGLSVQCSRCHDHKYEPISQKDYYRIQALFTPAVRPRGTLLPTNRRQIIAATPAQQEEAKKVNAAVDAALVALNQQQTALLADYRIKRIEQGASGVEDADRAPLIAALRIGDAQRTAEQKALVTKYRTAADATPEQVAAALPEFKQKQEALQQQRAAEERKRITYPEIRAFYDQDATPPPTPLLTRGDWLRPADPVEPGVPEILNDPRRPFTLPSPAPGAVTTGRRKAFAEWITRPDHPLTARVLVNRIWAHHFGVGIVPTIENFGRSGAAPTNRALLDWLATAFSGLSSSEPRVPGLSASKGNSEPGTQNPELNWSIKRLHRLIVTSSAYRQASALRPEAAKVDPDNRLLWRQRPRRLEAEAIRDGVLAVSGTLDTTMFGPFVGTETRPTGEIVAAGEEGKGRRSLYLLVRRSQPVDLLNAFDQPVMETNCTRRSPSATATQALALMNSSFVTAQAKHFAQRLLREHSPVSGAVTDPQTIEHAYLLALSRPPSAAERAASLQFLSEQVARYAAEKGATPDGSRERAYADFCQALLSANEFMFVD